MSVLLPAPFSPTSAWISPGWTSKDTRLKAWFEPKRFDTARKAIAGSRCTTEISDSPDKVTTLFSLSRLRHSRQSSSYCSLQPPYLRCVPPYLLSYRAANGLLHSSVCPAPDHSLRTRA